MKSRINILLLSALGVLFNNLQAQTLTGAHDPTVLKDDRCVYTLFTTNNLLQVRQSADEVNWKSVGNIFTAVPAWVNTALGATIPDIWAPCLRFNNGLYWVYYACSSFGTNNSVIGVATNPTLDSTSSSYKWTDRGLVIQSGSANNYNCIDPDMFVDSNGKVWLAFGSFWSGIKMIAIDPTTGKQLATDTTVYSLASRGGGAIEGASLMQHGSYYYLFTSWDTCCQGVSSTYNTRVGRSASVTGPYVDEAGTALMSSGGTELLSSYAQYIGPGGGDAFPDGRRTYFAHHYYDANHGGNPYLQVREIVFDNNGWCQITQPYLGRHEAFEAEHAHLANVAVSQTASASNGDYVTGITAAGSQVVFYVNALAAGNYEAAIRYANTGGTATQQLSVNGGTSLSVSYPSTGTTLQFSPTQAVTVNVTLAEGYNTLMFQPGTGSVALDRMDLLRTAGQLIPAGSDDHECSVTYQAAPNADVFSSGGDAQYENIDFGTGGYESLAVSFFGGCTGPLTLTLDSLTGTQVAVTNLSVAGAQTLVIPLSSALQTTTGAHDLYAQFTGSGGCSIGSFQFSTQLSTGSSTPTASPSLTASRTSTVSATATHTPTLTPPASTTATPTSSPTLTATPSASPTTTASMTSTRTATPSATASRTLTPTASSTPTGTPTDSMTATPSLTRTVTPTASTTATPTSSPTQTASATAMATASLTPTRSTTPTASPAMTSTSSGTATRTFTSTPSCTQTPTSTLTPANTQSFTRTPTSSPTPTYSMTVVPSNTFTGTTTSTVPASPTSSPSTTSTPTPVPRTNTPTWTVTPANTATPTGTITNTASETPISTATDTSTFSPTLTPSPTVTSTCTETAPTTLSPTASITPTVSRTVTPTASATPTSSPTLTRTVTPTTASTSTSNTTATATVSPSQTPLANATSTLTATPAASTTAVVFPNPVKGSGPVTLQFILASPAQRVEIQVFTMAFRLVNEVALTNLSQGTNEAPLPLVDRWGTSLADGLYYVVVKTPQGRFVVKLLVLR